MATWENEAKSVANTAKCTLCNGGFLRIYTAAYAGLLVELPLPNPCFAADVNGVANSNVIPAATATGAGTAAVYRIYKSDGTSIVVSGGVSLASGGGDIELDSLVISVGQSVSVNPITFTQS